MSSISHQNKLYQVQVTVKKYRDTPPQVVISKINKEIREAGSYGDCRIAHCLCGPCVIALPPDFLTGACGPHPANDEKRNRL